MSKLYYGNQLINKWYEEEDQIMKAYYGDTLMFGDEGEEPTPPTPSFNYCYDVTNDISTYTATTFSEVYDTSSNKWYMLNNFNQYEEYGVIEEVSCEAFPEEIPTYLGKLINHCDGNELECVEIDGENSQWEYLGNIETITEETDETITIDNTSPSPLIGTTFPTNFKIAKTSLEGRYVSININGTNGESLNVNYSNYSSPEYKINYIDQTVTDDGEYYVFESNEADFEVQYVGYWDSTPIDVIHTTITEETIYPKEYEEKEAPPSMLTFSTMAEANSYTGCVYNGIYANIGGSIYILSNDEWEETTATTKNYLSFTARNGNATIGLNSGTSPNLSYSRDGITWATWDYSNLTIPNGVTVYFKGNNTSGFSTNSNVNTFRISGSVESHGNVMSLMYGDDFETQNTLTNSTFKELFKNCTGLTTAPELPATTMIDYCYESMFNGCTSLTTAPILPATTLASNCYLWMFQGCSSLNYIKMMATDISASACLFNWVQGVAATGTFVKNSAATWNVSGDSGVPTGWTIQTASS